MKKSRLLGAVCALLCTFVTVSARAVYVPSGLLPGDTYQLVFVTESTIQALSSNIGVYNSFVQAQAEQNTLLTGAGDGVNYSAIVSVSGINANSNASVTGPVYNLQGAKIANSSADMWNGVNTPIYYDQFGTLPAGSPDVWSGSFSNGTQYHGRTLGSGTPIYGRSNLSGPGAIQLTSTTPVMQKHIYGLSDVITVSAVPVPAALWLFGSGLLGLVGIARRKKA